MAAKNAFEALLFLKLLAKSLAKNRIGSWLDRFSKKKINFLHVSSYPASDFVRKLFLHFFFLKLQQTSFTTFIWPTRPRPLLWSFFQTWCQYVHPHTRYKAPWGLVGHFEVSWLVLLCNLRHLVYRLMTDKNRDS